MVLVVVLVVVAVVFVVVEVVDVVFVVHDASSIAATSMMLKPIQITFLFVLSLLLKIINIFNRMARFNNNE